MKNKILLSTVALSMMLSSSSYGVTDTSFIARGANPSYLMDDTTYTGTGLLSVASWWFEANVNADASFNEFSLIDVKAWAATSPLNIGQAKTIKLQGGVNSPNSIVLDSSGNMTLANGALYVGRSAFFYSGNVGIGTTTPQADLHIRPHGFYLAGSAITASIRTQASTESNWDIRAYHLNPLNPLTGVKSRQFQIKDNNASTIPFKINHGAPNNALTIRANGNVGLGTSLPSAKLDVRGTIKSNNVISSKLNASDTVNNHNLMDLSVKNGGAGNSDVGFTLANNESGSEFQWAFRTFAPGEAFAATKIGTGGTEFEIDNLGSTTATTVVKMAGVTVFENGHMVTASSRELKTDIKPLDTQAALDALHKLQPVSYEYKAQKGEPVVGFIAEDVPELVAMPSRKSFDSAEVVAVLTSVVKEQEKQLKLQAEKIAKLEKMQKRLARVESLLTNLALETSNSKTEKVSLNK